MSSVVLELQRDALDQAVPVSDLLRKALVVSRKLSLGEFQEWIEKELNGYEPSDDVPEYRIVSGQVRAWNPYRGWIPMIFEDPQEGERASKRKSIQSVAEFEHLARSKSDDASLHMPFSQEVQRRLSQGAGFQTEVTLFVQRASLIRILDAVRTIILNWALKLEEDGIVGEGLSFSPQEKRAAVQSPQNVTNFFGPVQGAQVQQGGVRPIQVSATFDLDATAIRQFTDSLETSLDGLGLDDEEHQEVQAELKTVESQLGSPKPKTSIVRESLLSIRRILVGAGGGATGHLLVELGKLLS